MLGSAVAQATERLSGRFTDGTLVHEKILGTRNAAHSAASYGLRSFTCFLALARAPDLSHPPMTAVQAENLATMHGEPPWRAA